MNSLPTYQKFASPVRIKKSASLRTGSWSIGVEKERTMVVPNNVSVLAPPGRLLGTMEAGLLKVRIEKLIQQGARKIELDLTRVELANGPGLTFLLHTQKRLELLKGSLVLKNPTKSFRNILKEAHIESFFCIA
jgi:anti-anti-sigma regulatory factor